MKPLLLTPIAIYRNPGLTDMKMSSRMYTSMHGQMSAPEVMEVYWAGSLCWCALIGKSAVDYDYDGGRP